MAAARQKAVQVIEKLRGLRLTKAAEIVETAPPSLCSTLGIAGNAQATVTPAADGNEVEGAHIIARTVGQRRDRHGAGLALRRDREKRRDLYRRNVCRRRPDTQKSKGSSEPSLRSCTHVYRTVAGGQGNSVV
jgi:hypothetical protein